MKWEQVRIADVCEVTGGTTPSTINSNYWDGEVVWLSPVDLPEVGTIVEVSNSKKKVTQLALKDCSLKMLPAGAVVYSSRASIGKIGVVTRPLVTNQGFTNIIPGDRVNTRYLAYALKYFTPQIEKLGNSTTFNEVSRTSIKNFQIPLPPLIIQQQISDKLDKADALRRIDQELISKYDELAQSIFYELFGDLGEGQNRWLIKRFGDLITDIKAGTSLGGDEGKLKEGEIGILKISAITSGVFKPEEFKVPLQKSIPSKIITISKGDLLFSRANTRELVGAVAIAEADYPSLMLPDKLWKLVLDESQLLNYYCKFVLWNKHIRHQLTKTATGTSGSMLNISMSKLKDLKIPVPPLSLQIEFTNIYKSILAQEGLAKKTYSQSDNLFKQLMQGYF